MRPVSSLTQRLIKPFATIASAVSLSLAMCVLVPDSSYLHSVAFAQETNPASALTHNQASAGKTAVTFTQKRVPHRLIRKPAPATPAPATIVAPSMTPSDPTSPPLPGAGPIDGTASTNQSSQQEILATPSISGSAIQHSLSASSSATSSTIATAPHSGSPSGASTSSIAALSPSRATAAASGSTSAASTGSRSLGRLLSEMPGMSQLVDTPSPPPAPTSPVIGASPTSLSFTAQQGGGNPASRTLSISNTGVGTLTWSASSNAAWLTVSPNSGTDDGTITVQAATGSLTAGDHTAMITLAATGVTGVSPVPVQVTFRVTAAPSLTLNTSSLTFTATQGTNPGNQSVTVTSNGSWTASDNISWLTVSPTSGSNNGTIAASVNTTGVPLGSHSGTITVTGGGITRTVTVTLNLNAPAATLTLSTPSLTFTATQGTNPGNQSVTVTSNGSWTASDDATWLTVSPASSSNNGTITASVNTANASLGANSAVITVTGGGITRTVTVTLTLDAPATSSATLTWNASTESDLAGYKVYRATSSGAYGGPVAIVQGNVTSYLASGLQVGTTYFFVITAYDNAGNESAFSTEVSKSIF